MKSVGTIKYLFHDGVQGRTATEDQLTLAPMSSPPLQPPPSSHGGKRCREDEPTPPSLKMMKRQLRKLTAQQAMDEDNGSRVRREAMIEDLRIDIEEHKRR